MTGAEIIGWLGICILTCSALPQLYKTWKEQKIDGLSLNMLIMWVLGMGLMFVYFLMTSQDLPLLVNYSFNFIIESIILVLYLKIWIKNRK